MCVDASHASAGPQSVAEALLAAKRALGRHLLRCDRCRAVGMVGGAQLAQMFHIEKAKNVPPP